MRRNVSELLDHLRRTELHIDCVQMTLKRSSDGKTFSGPGYIRQRPTYGFEIKIYSAGTIDFRDVMAEWGSLKAGVLFSEGDHYSLVAKDETQRTWKAERIVHPGTNGTGDSAGYLVTAHCQEVALVEERSKRESGNWIELQSFEAIKFPCTNSTMKTVNVGTSRSTTDSLANVAEFDSNGLSFCFDEDQGLRVYASVPDKQLPAQLEWRITEAITFSLGAFPRWRLITRSEGREEVSRFRSPELGAKKDTQWPPYKIEVFDETGSIWRMFDLFLHYVLKNSPTDDGGLARSVNSVSQTRSSSVEGRALAIAVAVESLLNQFPPTVSSADEAMRASVDDLMNHIKKWPGNEKIIARALGAVAGIKNTRADDILRALIKKGAVGEEEWQAWKKLRNTAAHGNWHKYEGKLQELLDLTGKTLGLFNQLVFHLIGYRGKQTAYGTHDWPTVDYPPKVAAA